MVVDPDCVVTVEVADVGPESEHTESDVVAIACSTTVAIVAVLPPGDAAGRLTEEEARNKEFNFPKDVNEIWNACCGWYRQDRICNG